MQRELRKLVDAGELRRNSPIEHLPNIGEYLGKRISRTFNNRNLTVGRFLAATAKLDQNEFVTKLQRALQNERANQCTPDKYHVAEVNVRAWVSVVSLLKVMEALGRRFQFQAARLRLPPSRSEAAKFCACLSRSECRKRKPQCAWHDDLCLPRDEGAVGAPGIRPFSGQKAAARAQASTRRFPYSLHPGERYKWRRSGAVRKLPIQPVSRRG